MALALEVHVGKLTPPPTHWTAEHDDGSLTYSRAEVLALVASARSVGPFARDEDGAAWAVTMLDTYDATD